MKPIESYRRCEFCDKRISACSPPSNESYENAEIHIGEGSILLPERFVKDNNNHTADISGYYCNQKCLAAMIEKVLSE